MATLPVKLFDRLPVTFGAYCFEQMREWSLMFPAEQDSYRRLFQLLEHMPPAALDALFSELRQAESAMGVTERTWPRRQFTLEQVDFLNRNAHYPEWRAAVTRLFDRIQPALDAEITAKGRPRLVIVLAPAELPASPDRMWLRIAQRGFRLSIEPPENPGEFAAAVGATTLPAEYARRFERPYDTWAVESGDYLKTSRSVSISYTRLEPYRQRLMAEVNRLLHSESIQGPRQLSARLKQLKLLPAESDLAADPVLGEFVRSALLSGNGTLLINNTFVEWASVQAVRRARPSVAVIGFGVRNKVKPFSSLLIYADQEVASPIPTQMDILGTYVDLEVFYQYIWQEFEKYAEYRHNTAFLFAVAGMDQMLVIAPPDFPLKRLDRPVPLADVHQRMREWMNLA